MVHTKDDDDDDIINALYLQFTSKTCIYNI